MRLSSACAASALLLLAALGACESREPAFEAEALLDASLDDLEMRHVEQYAEALGAVGRPLTDLLLSRGCLRVVAGRLTPTRYIQTWYTVQTWLAQ